MGLVLTIFKNLAFVAHLISLNMLYVSKISYKAGLGKATSLLPGEIGYICKTV